MSENFKLKNGTVLLSTEAPGGIYNSAQLKKIAELCSKELAIVKATEDQRLALFVKESDLSSIAEQLKSIGLGFRNYQSGLHQPVACLGELCDSHEQPALATAMDLTKLLAEIKLKSTLKIGVNGCARCCTPCQTLDISVIGEANGYRVSLGGKTSQFPELASFFAEAVPSQELPRLLKGVVDVYQAKAEPGETLHEVLDRCGVEDFVAALAPYSQDAAGRNDPFADDFSPAEAAPASSESDESLVSSEDDDLLMEESQSDEDMAVDVSEKELGSEDQLTAISDENEMMEELSLGDEPSFGEPEEIPVDDLSASSELDEVRIQADSETSLMDAVFHQDEPEMMMDDEPLLDDPNFEEPAAPAPLAIEDDASLEAVDAEPEMLEDEVPLSLHETESSDFDELSEETEPQEIKKPVIDEEKVLAEASLADHQDFDELPEDELILDFEEHPETEVAPLEDEIEVEAAAEVESDSVVEELGLESSDDDLLNLEDDSVVEPLEVSSEGEEEIELLEADAPAEELEAFDPEALETLDEGETLLEEVEELDEVEEVAVETAEDTLEDIPELGEELLSSQIDDEALASLPEEDISGATMSVEEEARFEEKIQASIREERKLRASLGQDDEDSSSNAREAALRLLETAPVETQAPKARKETKSTSGGFEFDGFEMQGDQMRILFTSGGYLDLALQAIEAGESRSYRLGRQTLQVNHEEGGYSIQLGDVGMFFPYHLIRQAG